MKELTLLRFCLIALDVTFSHTEQCSPSFKRLGKTPPECRHCCILKYCWGTLPLTSNHCWIVRKSEAHLPLMMPSVICLQQQVFTRTPLSFIDFFKWISFQLMPDSCKNLVFCSKAMLFLAPGRLGFFDVIFSRKLHCLISFARQNRKTKQIRVSPAARFEFKIEILFHQFSSIH